MKSEKSSNGKIRSSGWETPAGWRHAAYVSWAVKARCHWLELRLKWEQSDEDRSQGSEHPRAKISHHWSFHVIRHQFQISRTRYLPLPGQFAVDAKGLNGGIYLFFFPFCFSFCRCALREEYGLFDGWNVEGLITDHDEKQISADHFQLLVDESSGLFSHVMDDMSR